MPPPYEASFTNYGSYELARLSGDVSTTERKPRVYFGGIAGCVAISCTHPLDLIKSNLQTHQGKLKLKDLISRIAKSDGIKGFYRGLSAALLRQLTYTLTRFGIYEYGKQFVNTDTFPKKVGLAFFGGVVGGIVGTPADMVNVRMQNDSKLPMDQRRNYKNAFHGLFHIYKHEGPLRLFAGGLTASVRGGLVNTGQLAFYEQLKHAIMKHVHHKDDFITHLASSTCSGLISATMTHPIEVIKTRSMNAKPGEFQSLWALIKYTAQQGPIGFYKGYVPSLSRIVPNSIVMLMTFEELRIRYGIDPPPKIPPPGTAK